jgi:hypothetical protein
MFTIDYVVERDAANERYGLGHEKIGYAPGKLAGSSCGWNGAGDATP